MGRPTYKPSDEQRAQVRQWVNAKVSVLEMARRLELAPKTFRKHFADEIGADRVETVITRPSIPRTAFRATDEQREMALILAGARWPYEDIALNLGIPVDVLEEHFAEELRDGPVKFPAPVIRSMWHAAQGGNATAAKIILIMNGAGSGREPAKDAPQPAANGMMGKKAAAAVAAQNAEAGTPWESLVTPGGKPN